MLQKESVDLAISSLLAKKRAEGVRDADIRWWWNLHYLERRMMLAVDDIYRLTMFAHVREEKGVDPGQAASHVRKHMPMYGDPSDSTHATGEDRLLPYELKERINVYFEKRAKTDPTGFKQEIAEASSFNALLRSEMKRGRLEGQISMASVEDRIHFLHAAVAKGRDDHSGRLAKSISEEFGVGASESREKVSMLVTGYLIFLIDSFLRERESDSVVADGFLRVVGKSEEAMGIIRQTFGDSYEAGKAGFQIQLRDFLGVPVEASLSEYYEIVVRTAAETALELSKRAVIQGHEINLR